MSWRESVPLTSLVLCGMQPASPDREDDDCQVGHAHELLPVVIRQLLAPFQDGLRSRRSLWRALPRPRHPKDVRPRELHAELIEQHFRVRIARQQMAGRAIESRERSSQDCESLPLAQSCRQTQWFLTWKGRIEVLALTSRKALPYLASRRRSPCQQPKRW